MNIAGKWSYREDFGLGKSEGEVILFQTGNKVSGKFIFTEKVENDYEILVTETVEGTFFENRLLLESTEVKALQDEKEIEYLPNNFEVFLVSESKLVGSTYDCENVCGVFVMEKEV